MPGKKNLTDKKKWTYVLITVLIFIVVSMPRTYELTNSFLENIVGKIAFNGCPTTYGLLIHAFVFAIILKLSMDYDVSTFFRDLHP